MTKEKLQVVVPRSKQLKFLRSTHEESGHQGIDRTMDRLSEVAYWVRMVKVVENHCRYCMHCQVKNSLESRSAPLQAVIAVRHWEQVVVDIMKVPMFSKGNRYLLVAQDYFSKWSFT